MKAAEIKQPKSKIFADKESRDNACAFFDLLDRWQKNAFTKTKLKETLNAAS